MYDLLAMAEHPSPFILAFYTTSANLRDEIVCYFHFYALLLFVIL